MKKTNVVMAPSHIELSQCLRFDEREKEKEN